MNMKELRAVMREIEKENPEDVSLSKGYHGAPDSFFLKKGETKCWIKFIKEKKEEKTIYDKKGRVSGIEEVLNPACIEVVKETTSKVAIE